VTVYISTISKVIISSILRVKNGSKTHPGIKKMKKMKLFLEPCHLHNKGMKIVRTQILKAKV
jgi:hypothetical protein